MVENLTRSAVLKDKLSTAATDIFQKIDKTVQSIGGQKPTEESPTNYKVTHKGGALVRSGYETTSSQVHQLAAGEVVTIVELVGRRARIIAPVEGWVSTETKDGVQIMRPCTVQRTSVKNEAFEQMFEQKFNRLKNQQQRSGGGGGGGPSGHDPRADDFRDSPRYSPREYSDEDDGRRDRDRDDRDRGRPSSKAGGGTKSSSSGGDVAFVPRLAAPGSSQGPVVLAPPGGSNRPAAAAGGGSRPPATDTADLLSMEEPAPMAGGRAQASAGGSALPFDPFGPSDFTSAPAPAPAVPGPAVAATVPNPGGGDWAGFQAGQSAAMGGSTGAGFGGLGVQTQPPGGATSAGQPAGWNPGWGGALGQAPAPQAGMQDFGQFTQAPPAGLQAAAGNWAAFGAGGAGARPLAPPANMAAYGNPGWAALGQTGAPSGAPGPASQAGTWAAFGSPGVAAGFRPPGPGGGAPPSLPGGGYQFPGMPGGPAGQPGVDDLMSKAMQGVSNLSLDQRRAATQGTGSTAGVPMNMMRAGMR